MPVTTLRHSFAFVLLLFVASPTVSGQEPRPAELDEEIFVRGDTVTLNWAWRFRPGDDPRWADPKLDDSGWGTAEPLPSRPEHVLAVRYEISRERLERPGSGGGFLVSIESPDAAGLTRGEERRVTLAAIVLAVASFLALGDAAGHGLAAGTLVTAVKAIFTVLDTGPGLAATLAEYDRALRGMNVHSRHMCLTLARITPVAATVCSAAMPPALLYRAETSEVEELGAGGLPLGARLRSGWQERRTALAPGDTLLFATDGLAEGEIFEILEVVLERLANDVCPASLESCRRPIDLLSELIGDAGRDLSH